MEIELKYSIDGKEKAERLWEALLSDVCMAEGLQIVKGSQKETAMKAVYFDAGDGRLSQETISEHSRRARRSPGPQYQPWSRGLTGRFTCIRK